MQEIKIKKENLPITKDFCLSNMTRFNIIVGQNNVGKTKFFESIEKQYEKSEEIRVVYIRANDVDPSDDQFKESAATSQLIANVVKLFSNLNIPIKVQDESGLKDKLQFLVERTNENFKKFTLREDMEVKNDVSSTSVKIEPIIQSLFNKFLIKEEGVNEELKISQIGQGYQRMFVASILKSYVDLYKEYGPREEDGSRETLILFEEPEIFLHPELKRNVNRAIKEILNTDPRVTIIVSTHDPYFLYSNLNENDIKIYAFKKQDNKTLPPEEGVTDFGNVADENLHIALFNKVHSKLVDPKPLGGPGMETETTRQMVALLNDPALEDMRSYDGVQVLLPIYIRNVIHHRDISTINNGDIEKSIKILSKILENQI